MKSHALTIITLSLLFGPAAATAEVTDVTIAAAKAKQGDAGLALAIDDLKAAIQTGSHRVSVVYQNGEEPLPPGDLIVVGPSKEIPTKSSKPLRPEGFCIRPLSLDGRRVVVVEGDRRGLMYGLFKLAERVRVGSDPWKVSMESAPAFPLRIFSEEGQLLDIPDLGYYSDEPPYVDQARLQKEVDEAKRLVDHIAALGYNTIALLHLSFEEYIDYRYLDKPVYPPDDPHRARSPVFCKYLKQLCDYAHARHVDVYLQLYEIQFPPKLDELYNVDLDSPNIERIITAKTRELFERVPLDGLVITATETHPRCGYRSKQLWRKTGLPGAGRMLTMYHNACKSRGKTAIFRLWRIAANAAGLRQVAEHIPSDAMLSMKNTGGDFFLSSPTTDVVTSGVARQQPVTIVFDTFREFDGWSRLFVYMKRWGPIVRACRDKGVMGINAWGPWSAGCIWPDWEPGYMLDGKLGKQQLKVSWAGHWNNFRMFTRGFTPGQANAYLLARLGWDPDADVAEIARDFAALHVGPANAAAAAKALMASEDAFAEEYLKKVHPCHIKWTMVFSARPQRMEEAYQANPLEGVLASNTRALEQVRQIEAAFARTDPARATNPKQYAAFKEGIEKTALYLRTFYLWRQCWWRHRADRDLSGQPKADNIRALAADKSQLMGLFAQWKRWPEEAGHWRITFRHGRPKISPDETFPYWYPRGEQTMETTSAGF